MSWMPRRPLTTAPFLIPISVLRAVSQERRAAANAADQHALAAGQSADSAGKAAQEAYNRVDTLNGVVANLDNYKSLKDVNVTFAFDKAVLTADDKAQLDELASSLQSARGYISNLPAGPTPSATRTTTTSSASVVPTL